MATQKKEATTINDVEVCDYDGETPNSCTIKVTATAAGETVEFFVQTLDGEYRPSLHCWIYTDYSKGDLGSDDYPAFDFDVIEAAAEAEAEEIAGGKENPRYFNKVATPYERRFIDEEAEAEREAARQAYDSDDQDYFY